MSLRQKINLVFCMVSILILGLLVAVEINAARSSVREEMEASNRIAAQLLSRVSALYQSDELRHLAEFLNKTGRVRANDIELRDDFEKRLYVSPPSTYKAGRNSPRWYAALVTPVLSVQTIALDGGSLHITANPSRAVLDAWDDLKRIVLGEAILLLAADLAILFIVGRWLAPLERIQDALRAIERGQHQVRLPPLAGKEAGEMGRAFNRMAQAVEENSQVRYATAEAKTRLSAQREFTALLHQRIEEERAALARELHDELGQSLTGIRSIAKSLMQNPDIQGSATEVAAQMMFDTAGATSDALQRMIPRLRPLQLEGMSVVDAVRDLVADILLTNPALKIDMTFDATLPALSENFEISAYRIVQEALTNVVKHAGATQVALSIHMELDYLRLRIADNGVGAGGQLIRAGHYGVRGMQERAESLGGTVRFQASALGGLEVDVALPVVLVAQ